MDLFSLPTAVRSHLGDDGLVEAQEQYLHPFVEADIVEGPHFYRPNGQLGLTHWRIIKLVLCPISVRNDLYLFEAALPWRLEHVHRRHPRQAFLMYPLQQLLRSLLQMFRLWSPVARLYQSRVVTT